MSPSAFFCQLKLAEIYQYFFSPLSRWGLAHKQPVGKGKFVGERDSN